MVADTKKSIVCAGVYDGLTARVALAQGIGCLYLCTAATNLARSGILGPRAFSQEFVMDLARTVRQIGKDVPLIGEVDRSMHVEAVKAALVRFHHAEIAAMQIDDEASNRCSDKNPAKTRAIEDAFLGRIQAAVDERFQIGSDIVIFARTNMLLACRCEKCCSRAISLLQGTVKMVQVRSSWLVTWIPERLRSQHGRFSRVLH